jgi:hypothetical protein
MRLSSKIFLGLALTITFLGLPSVTNAQLYTEVPACAETSIIDAVINFGLTDFYRYSEEELLDCYDQINAAHYETTWNLRNNIGTNDDVDLNELEYDLRTQKERFAERLAQINSSQYSNGVPDGERAQLEVERQRAIIASNTDLDDEELRRNAREASLAAGQQRQADADAAGDEVTYECSIVPGFFSLNNCINAAIVAIGNVVIFLVSQALVVANEIFNFVITLSIRDFSQYVSDNPGVTTAWQAARDIINISFIFILLYIAIGTMFELFNAKKLLVNVIIIALLINFSALLPKVIIDASNLLALEFYNRIGDGETFSGAPDVTKTIVASLGLTLNNGEKLYDRYSKNETPQLPHPNLSSLALLAGIFGKIIFLLVTAVILAVGAWMFLLRTIVLIFLIVLSPLAVAAYMLPQTQKYFSQWFQKLLSSAFFAPAYLFLLYLVITIVKGTDLQSFAGGNIKSNSYFDVDVIKITINFIFITVMMGAALIIAHSMGAQGAGTATKWAGKAKGLGLGLLGGTAGLAGAYSVGKFAKKAADSKLVKKWASNKPILGGGLARDTLNKLAGQKFGSSASYNERTEKVAKRIEGFKTPELQANYLASLRPVDREEAFKKLSDRQKSILNAGVEKLPDTDRRKQAVEGLIGGLSYEEREKMDKSRADAEKQKGEAIARIDTERAIQLLTEGKRRKIEGYEKNLAGEEDKSRPIYAKHKDKGYENQYVYEDVNEKDLPVIKSGEQPISESDLMGRLETEQIAKIIKDVPIGSAGKLKKILDVRDKDNNNIIESKNKVAKMVVQNMNKNQLLKLFEKDADLKDDQIEVINKALNDRDARIPQEIKENIERLQKAVANHPKAKSLGIEIPIQNNPGSPNPSPNPRPQNDDTNPMINRYFNRR